MLFENEIYKGQKVKINNSKKHNYKDVVGRSGTIDRISGSQIGVKVPGFKNEHSMYGVFWLDKHELTKVYESEEKDMALTGFKHVAIVNLLEDYNKKDYGFALYEPELRLLESGHAMVVVDPRGKNNRVLGLVQDIILAEEYGKNVTAQVVGVVNMDGYNARVAEEERLSKLAKKKAAVEKELRAEVEKINNLELYEKMAKEHPENPRLAELVKELKELEELEE